MTRDLILTWPKSRPLDSYLRELKQAERNGEVINFRVASPPKIAEGQRWGYCYMVHDGYVRGWMQIIDVVHRGPGEVNRVASDDRSGSWPEGWYVVREPIWHPMNKPVPMPGFRGFRYVVAPGGGFA